MFSYKSLPFLSLAIVLFLFSFNQSILWNLKDSLMITAAGAEVIPFIKVWAILPSAILLTYVFTKLSSACSQEKVFYLLTTVFLLFYLLFAFVIYPSGEKLHPLESAAYLDQILPKGFVLMYRYWTLTLFYVMCELWNTIVICVLFWGFVNQRTKLSQAPRFYGALTLVYNIAIVAAGMVSIGIAQGKDRAWEHTLMLLMLLVVGCGLLAMAIFRWMHRNALECVPEDLIEAPSKDKIRFSLSESLRHVSKSNYLICLVVVVLAYSLVINLVEVIWKDQLKTLYPAAIDYHHYMNNLQIIQGVLAISLSLGTAKMIERLGWTYASLTTPVLMMLCCIGFFGTLFFQEILSYPLTIVVFFGAAQNCISKACKYSIFDSTKEMAFIPLSHESKIKGKAAIDGIGYRLGKSVGSIVHQSLLILLSSVSRSSPYVCAVVMGALVFWMTAIRRLGAQVLPYCEKKI